MIKRYGIRRTWDGLFLQTDGTFGPQKSARECFSMWEAVGQTMSYEHLDEDTILLHREDEQVVTLHTQEPMIVVQFGDEVRRDQ